MQVKPAQSHERQTCAPRWRQAGKVAQAESKSHSQGFLALAAHRPTSMVLAATHVHSAYRLRDRDGCDINEAEK
jgi:hypothetical protein